MYCIMSAWLWSERKRKELETYEKHFINRGFYSKGLRQGRAKHAGGQGEGLFSGGELSLCVLGAALSEWIQAAAVEIVTRYGFQVNDLYALSVTLPPEAHSDAVHYYTPIGTKAFTEQVLSYLLPAIGEDSSMEYREELYTDEPVGI